MEPDARLPLLRGVERIIESLKGSESGGSGGRVRVPECAATGVSTVGKRGEGATASVCA